MCFKLNLFTPSSLKTLLMKINVQKIKWTDKMKKTVLVSGTFSSF